MAACCSLLLSCLQREWVQLNLEAVLATQAARRFQAAQFLPASVAQQAEQERRAGLDPAPTQVLQQPHAMSAEDLALRLREGRLQVRVRYCGQRVTFGPAGPGHSLQAVAEERCA